MSKDDYKFLYWDDYENDDMKKPELKDWQKEIINRETWIGDKLIDGSVCNNHAQQQEEDEEREAEKRMQIIMRNGNSGEHYFDYFNNHPSSADVWDDGEEEDIE